MKTFLKSDSSFLWLVFTWIIGCGLPWPRYPISLDNSTYFKEKLCLPQWISRCLWPSTFPREAKSKGSQTSYFIIISNEWGSLPFPVDILIEVCWICLNTWLALPQESDTFYYRFCQERQPVNVARIWVTHRPLDFSEPFVKIQGHCVRTQLKDQETSYIHHRHSSKMHILLPVWCVQWRNLTYMPGLGLARTDCCDCFDRLLCTADWTHYSWLDLIIENHYSRCWNLLIKDIDYWRNIWKIPKMS